jgi:hypothetical protein
MRALHASGCTRNLIAKRRTLGITMQLFALALIATVLPLSANSDSQPVKGATAQAAADQVICKPMYHDGMLIRKAVCHTQEEWDMIVKRNEQDFRTFQQRDLIQLNH